MASINTIEAGATHSDGVKIGNTGEKLGFLGATPIVQRASANGAALTDSTGGTAADATLAAIGATNSGDVSGDINNNFAKIAELVNELRTTVVNFGLHKGSA